VVGLSGVTLTAVTEERFEELVTDALDGLPHEIGALMDNVAVFVEAGSATSGLLGLYQGIPLTHRQNYGVGMVMPDRITIYRDAILAHCQSDDDVVQQVRITVVHEVGHHFGLDDRRLRELGYG
jgi:predicted Zn-dependent protease with MMP-like domain